MNAHWRMIIRRPALFLVVIVLLACVVLLSLPGLQAYTMSNSATISGTVVKQGAPSQGKRIEFVKDAGSPDELIVAVIETDSDGNYSYAVELDTVYELRGFGDTTANELHEWVMITTPTAASPDIVLPTIEIWYDGLLMPNDGASYDENEVSELNPILFSWSSRGDAVRYNLWLRIQGNWANSWGVAETTETSAEFNGVIDGGRIAPSTYDWQVGMSLDNGWWVWSELSTIIITGEQVEGSFEGYVLKQGAAARNKYVEVVQGVGTSEEMIVAFTHTDDEGYYKFTNRPTGTRYEIRGFGDQSQNELHEWVMQLTPASADPDITLPTIDIWYDGLLSPADGETYARDAISASNPIQYVWSPREGAESYKLYVRQPGQWQNAWLIAETTGTSASHDGTLDGEPMPPMAYAWHVGMSLENGWWVWSEHRLIELTLSMPEAVFLPLVVGENEAAQ